MWFADIGLGLAWIILAGWMLVAGLAATVGRTAMSTVVPRSVQVPLSVGTGAAIVLFAAQAGLVDTVEDRAGPGWLDQSVWAWFVGHRAPAATTVMTAVSAAGGTAGMAVLALIGAGLLWRMRRRTEAGIVIGAAVGAWLLVEGFKHLYDRARPPASHRPADRHDELRAALRTRAGVDRGARRARRGRGTAGSPARRPGQRGGTRDRRDRDHRGEPALPGRALGDRRVTGWLLGGAWLALCVTTLVLIQRRPQPAPASTPAPSGRDDERRR